MSNKMKENEINNKPKNKKTKIIISVSICIALVLIAVIIYFCFIKDDENNTKSKKDNNPSVKPTNKDKKIDFDIINSKVKESKKYVVTKCDCSKVKSETDANKAVCTKYVFDDNSSKIIIDKLKEAKKTEEIATGTVCSTYSFDYIDSKDNSIFGGFVGDNQKSIIVGYDEVGFALDYDKDLKSFFEDIISKSKKIDDKEDIKDDSNSELSKDEISLLIGKIKKYELLDLANPNKKVTFDGSVTNEMLYSMFYYIEGLDDSFAKHWEDESSWSFGSNKADEYFKDAFGFTPKEYKNLICSVDDEILLNYDKDNETFTYNDEHPGHGGGFSGFIDYNVVSSSKNGNLYTINALFLRGNEMDGYYINDSEFTIDQEYEDDGTSIYKNEFKKINPSKYTKFTFTFEKVNNNYYLKSISTTK